MLIHNMICNVKRDHYCVFDCHTVSSFEPIGHRKTVLRKHAHVIYRDFLSCKK